MHSSSSGPVMPNSSSRRMPGRRSISVSPSRCATSTSTVPHSRPRNDTWTFTRSASFFIRCSSAFRRKVKPSHGCARGSSSASSRSPSSRFRMTSRSFVARALSLRRNSSATPPFTMNPGPASSPRKACRSAPANIMNEMSRRTRATSAPVSRAYAVTYFVSVLSEIGGLTGFFTIRPGSTPFRAARSQVRGHATPAGSRSVVRPLSPAGPERGLGERRDSRGWCAPGW